MDVDSGDGEGDDDDEFFQRAYNNGVSRERFS